MPNQRRPTTIARCAAIALACTAIAGCAAPSQGPADESIPFPTDAFDEEAHDQGLDAGKGLPASQGTCDEAPAAEPCPDPASVGSPYDLEAILSLDPAQIPSTLEGLGFKHERGVPSGAWEGVSAETPCSPAGSTTRLFFTVGGGETSPELMLEGRRPQAAGMGIMAPLAGEDEAEAVCASLLEAAGLEDELSRTVEENHRFDRRIVTRIGNCPAGSTGILWCLSAWSQQMQGESAAYSFTSYTLTVYTREGVLASQDQSLMEAIGIFDKMDTSPS